MIFWTVEDTFQLLPDLPDGNLLEFGVYNGNTLARLVKEKVFDEVWGFDSFEGLPPNNEGNPDWPQGAFNSVRDNNLSSAQEIMDYIKNRVGRQDINLIKGFFDQTLTKELGIQLANTASYIHLDCDLFSSTKTCLDWIFRYKVAKPGCLLRYDDWYGYSNMGGQKSAHQISQIRYNLNFEIIADNIYLYRG